MVNSRLAEIGPIPISPNSPQWYRVGEKCEHAFVTKMNQLGVECLINPDKRANKKLPDLIVNGRLADLKAQMAHFYNSEKLYGIPPTKVFTINRKDIQYYTTCYPDLDVYIWLMKQPLVKGKRVLPAIDEVWHAHIKTLAELCETAPEHSYRYRTDSSGQAKSSFVLSTDNLIRIA